MTQEQMQNIADLCLRRIAIQYGSTTRRDFRVIEIVLELLAATTATTEVSSTPAASPAPK